MAFLNLRLRVALFLSVSALLAISFFVSTTSHFGSLAPLASVAHPFSGSTVSSVPQNAPQYHGYHSEYSFDIDLNHAPRWMTALPSELSLTAFSIPGTHDSITSVINGHEYQCQNHDLAAQLEAGIRYFDIRARLKNNELLIYHQDSFTKHSYADVLTTMFHFLDSNPGEAIIMRLKQESTPIDSTIDFDTAFNYYRLNSSITSAGCTKHFWIPSTPDPHSIPTLGELRNKILILQNFGSVPAEYGIKFESPLLQIEDLWDLPDLKSLDQKFEWVQENLLAAGKGTVTGDGLLYLSHLSASVGILPIEAAAGDKKEDVRGINDRTGKWLQDGNGDGLGVVIIDFPGQKLVQEILRRNER